jgi:coenzyme F420-reducing hydrogenase gamma subunit
MAKTKKTIKLKVGWFTFTCSEDSTIMFTELMNEHHEEWFKLIDFRNFRLLKKKGEIKDLDIAFVEGAICDSKDAEKLKEIRKNCKKLIAIGSCAVVGKPSGQRMNFNKEQKKEIEFIISRFHYSKKVYALHELVKVDESVPGCPMDTNTFLNILNKQLKEFGVKNA